MTEILIVFSLWMVGALIWRIQKWMGWSMAAMKTNPNVGWSDYFKANKFSVVADICGHVVLGIGWASGMVTNALMAGAGFQYSEGVTHLQKGMTAMVMGAMVAPYATQIIESWGKKMASKIAPNVAAFIAAVSAAMRGL